MWLSYICVSLFVASLLGIGLWVLHCEESRKDGKPSKK